MRGTRDALLGALLLATPVMAVIAWGIVFPSPLYNRAVFDYARSAFAECTPLSELDRTVRCDAFVKYWQGCQNSNDGCHIKETYKVLTRLGFNPPSLYIDTSGLKPLK